jgi:hypothetical protein
MASFDVENENKGGSKLSEDTHKALLDGCLANGIINTGMSSSHKALKTNEKHRYCYMKMQISITLTFAAIGLGSGVALSAVLFKREFSLTSETFHPAHCRSLQVKLNNLIM